MAVVCACVLALPVMMPLALGQNSSAAPVSPAESTSSAKRTPEKPRGTPCPAGVKLRLGAPLALQGSLVLAEVRSAILGEGYQTLWPGHS